MTMATKTMTAMILTMAMTRGLELGEGVGVISEDGLGPSVEEEITLAAMAVACVNSLDQGEGSSTSRFQTLIRKR